LTRSAPFLCAETSAIARSLISAVSPDGDVRLFINDDTELSGSLVEAGGCVVRHLLQMEGALT
jgi:hypothetical protein